MTTDTAFDTFIHEQAKAGRKRIGIGILHPDEAIVDSLLRAQEFCDLVVIGQDVKGITSLPTLTPEEVLIAKLQSGEIDVIVRGQANATILRAQLVERFHYPPDKIKDLGVVKDNLGRVFIACGISHGQGWTVDQKIELIREAVDLLRVLNLPVKIGVTSGARPDEVGPISYLVPYIAETYADADKIVGLLGTEMTIKHYYIDIEKAIADQCTILVFANGMVGNHVLRSLVFLGQIKIYGGIISGIDQLVVESFRNSSGFFEYLEFTNALANLRKRC
jgi:predicted methyltransferase MtxX (methanogen marker protein 4)